jgi:hypothetical protein
VLTFEDGSFYEESLLHYQTIPTDILRLVGTLAACQVHETSDISHLRGKTGKPMEELCADDDTQPQHGDVAPCSIQLCGPRCGCEVEHPGALRIPQDVKTALIWLVSNVSPSIFPADFIEPGLVDSIHRTDSEGRRFSGTKDGNFRQGGPLQGSECGSERRLSCSSHFFGSRD